MALKVGLVHAPSNGLQILTTPVSQVKQVQTWHPWVLWGGFYAKIEYTEQNVPVTSTMIIP